MITRSDRLAAASGLGVTELESLTALARRALDLTAWPVERVALAEQLGAEVSRVAPAHALALIARGALQ